MSQQSQQSNRAAFPQPGLSIENLDSTMVSLKRDLEHLTNKAGVLPRVDKNGASDCPFAEELYADKAEAVENVVQHLRDIKRYLPLVEQEVARCSKNLSTISSDKERLVDENAINQYQHALYAQKHLYQKAVDRRKALQELVQRAERTLNKANAKKYPGKKLEKRFQPPAGSLGRSYGPHFSTPSPASISKVPSQPSLAEREMSDLLSLGPLASPSVGKLGP